jgi:hypothetical protein
MAGLCGGITDMQHIVIFIKAKMPETYTILSALVAGTYGAKGGGVPAGKIICLGMTILP